MKSPLLPLTLLLTLSPLPTQSQADSPPPDLQAQTLGQHSESYQSLTFNGAWSWFSNPAARFHAAQKSCTYSSYIDNSGNITVASYNHFDGSIHSRVIKKNLVVDDRHNPSLLVTPDGHILVFYHAQGRLCCMRSTDSEAITQWGAELEVARYSTDADANAALPTDAMVFPSLAPISTPQSLILFWTNAQGTAMLSESQDGGKSWSSRPSLVHEPLASLKAYSKDGKKVHLALTSPEGKAYYKNYPVSDLLALDQASLPSLKDYKLIGEGHAIVWDMTENDQGQVVLAYSTSKDATTHLYHYATGDSEQWTQLSLGESGGTFVKPLKATGIEMPYYAAGISIDHETPKDIYLSIKRNNVFEIEKWSLLENGQDWDIESITQDSEKDNIRPQSVQGALEGNPLQVMWMTNTNYYGNKYPTASKLHWADRFQSAIKMDIPSPSISNYFDPEQIKDIMRQTADWQFANPYDLRRLTDWHWGTYLVGLEELYQLTGEDRYKQEMINIGNGANWRINDQILYVDMITIISNWAWLYEHEKDPKMIEQSQWALDVHLRTRRKSRADVRFANNPYFDEWWTWCDALFVAPPAFAAMYKATGENKYLDYMDDMYWITYDYLYSEEDQLVYRDDRYFTQRSENGKKIFWGRGNGWVIAGLCRILNMMPKDYKSREKYEQAFKKLSHKLLEIQSADGGWRVSLLDPEYQDEAEMSGSAFIVYALAWGLNRGLLEEKYRPQIEKGWETMCRNINLNGRFGNVQSEGIDPRNFTEDDWQVYGTGAFLMAGAEIYKMVGGE